MYRVFSAYYTLRQHTSFPPPFPPKYNLHYMHHIYLYFLRIRHLKEYQQCLFLTYSRVSKWIQIAKIFAP